jgi:hypothetical protein
MTRRSIAALMMIPDPPVEKSGYPPTDARKLNEFAASWNGYVKELSEGKVNYKLWRAVTHGWSELNR